jgi:UDP-N-acetylmuramoylalanine-D-glutamate ligase
MLETFQPKCNIALVSNIYTCHLDWHNDDFLTYKNAKLNILKNTESILLSDDIKDTGQSVANYDKY